MNTLFLAWQAPDPKRAWFPIGRLDVSDNRKDYYFRYLEGARSAKLSEGFKPMPVFPDLEQIYHSPELFSMFQNRVMTPQRKDFDAYLSSLNLDSASYDPLEVLAVTGGERATDNFEVFPKISKLADGSFKCRFFLHGLRHTAASAQRRAETLVPAEKLGVSIELTNPATRTALQLLTSDYQMIGWAPRYLVNDLLRAIANQHQLQATVVRINEAPAPEKRRLLIELQGQLPSDYEPMSSELFRPISALTSDQDD
ncbi:MAG: hypothetical protein Q7J29_05225 [Stagnimonas sp.]|nr:hypothetical protein [Stagnimonas sp.]